ncbi:hypothetical protein E7744_13840 [Citricoccus sp. SGAir0253]|uniref:hypothetical protein n=1 Tax=Citricoccus sp. SGAir0253 TaxID=2567881 RepID=UPI0010CD34DD|nr:hypothetical protein [Citricoccus sp. SGAir0253]QCU79093.1 hypothetical protein E7744_13840 [Citricoccus sp. SGAir0253]
MSTPSTGPQPPRPGGAPQERREGKPGFLSSIKGPLLFSFALALIGGVVATLTASGGTDNPWRVDIGLIAFGAFFIVSLVVVAMLQLAAKDNPDHLSQGSGVHRSSEELHRQAVARRKAEAQRRREEAARRPDEGERGER